MNRLVIIGNGFDMAHGLRTSYMDFINWYWDQRVYGFIGKTTNVSQDCLCKLVIKETGDFSCWNVFAASNSYFFKDLYQKERYSGSEVFQEIKQHPETFMVECSPFFETILQSIESKGWVDIENDYYQLLKDSINNPRCEYTITGLNQQLAFIQSKLVEYLSTIKEGEYKSEYQKAITDYFNPDDFSTEGRVRALDNMGLDFERPYDKQYFQEEHEKLAPERIMLLS